jgi:hypothetical protein
VSKKKKPERHQVSTHKVEIWYARRQIASNLKSPSRRPGFENSWKTYLYIETILNSDLSTDLCNSSTLVSGVTRESRWRKSELHGARWPSVPSIASEEIQMDDWGVDVPVISASQKGGPWCTSPSGPQWHRHRLLAQKGPPTKLQFFFVCVRQAWRAFDGFV